MRIFSVLFAVLILLFGISFAVLNANAVSINYYVGSAQLALSLLLAIVLIIGVFIGLISSVFLCLKTKKKQHQLSKQLHNAQKEINNLRKLPLEKK